HPLSEPRRLGYPTRYLADLLPANAEVARLRVAVLGSLEHDAIAPFELRLIERLVRDLDQALQTPRRVRLHDRDANAHRHDAAVRTLVRNLERLHVAPDLLRQGARVIARRPVQQQHELLSAVTRREVERALRAARDRLRDALQRVIARLVAVEVVVNLE